MPLPNSSPNTDPLFSGYAPLRCRDLYWWKYAVGLAKEQAVTVDGRLRGGDDVRRRILEDVVAPALRAAVSQAKADHQLHVGMLYASLMSLLHWIPMAAQYELSGRQIFDLSEGLLWQLNMTDVDAVTMEDLSLPYPAFFIRFGKQAHLKLPFTETESEYLDGVLVAQSTWDEATGSKRLLLALTTVQESGQGMTLPGYFIDFTPDMLAMPVREAIERAIERRRQIVKREAEDRPDLAEQQIARYEETAKLMTDCLPLLVNALFYLDGIDASKMPREPQAGVPPALATKWACTNERQRQKLTSVLFSEGFAVVRLLGREFEVPAEERGAGAGRTKASWHRGHYRWQPHGPKNTLRKRIRIPPTLHVPKALRQSGAPVIVDGHIYKPGPGSA